MPEPCGCEQSCCCNAVALNLCFTQGDSYQLNLTYGEWSDATPPVFVPIDITGGTFLLTFKAPSVSGPNQFSIGTDSGDAVITDAANGEFAVIIPTSATKSLAGNQLSGVYDLVLNLPTDATGKPWRQTILNGTLKMTPAITPIP